MAITGRRLAILLVVLAAASEFKLRSRDATEALEGVIDAQIIAELGIYALVGAWLVMAAFRRGDALTSYLPGRFGIGMATFTAICGLALVTSLYAPTLLSVVRAVQFTLFAAVALTVARLVRDDEAQLVSFWVTIRRSLWALIAIGVVGTLALFGPVGPVGIDEGRYAWFQMHPISTANIIGLGLLALAGAWFGLPDPWFRRRDGWLVAVPAGLILTLLLMMTKSRGPLAATIGALVVTALLSPHRSRRALFTLVMCAGAGAVLMGAGVEILTEVITRGRSTQELLTLTGRTELLGIAFELFKDRPLTGYGFLAARSVFLDAVPWAPGHAHNLFAEIAISFGIPGLIAYLVLFASIIRAAVLAAVSRERTVRRLLLVEGGALLAFVLLTGVVGGGAANLPGFELLALVLSALLADLWRRGRLADDAPATSAAPVHEWV